MIAEKFLISVDELRGCIDDPGVRVVDCRFELLQPENGFRDYLAGHIPGAVYAHLDRDLAAPVGAATGRHPLPGAEAFAGTLGRWGIASDTHVVAYDAAGGAIAARLWWLTRWIGHRRVSVLDGGFGAWRRAGMPVSTEPPSFAPRSHPARPDNTMIVDTDDVLRMLEADTQPVIVDARSAARFRGDSEPIDPVAGHIPGARNLPCEQSLRDDGTWRSPRELAARWNSVLAPGEQATWIAMCGSGVTACHLALSAGLAGLPPPRLYAGSWSEWIRDAARPVATGPAAAAAGEA